MENHDLDAIKKLLASDHELRKLYQEHELLEEKISKIENRNFLTPDEQVELKALKMKKLRGVEQMMRRVTIRGEGAVEAVPAT